MAYYCKGLMYYTQPYHQLKAPILHLPKQPLHDFLDICQLEETSEKNLLEPCSKRHYQVLLTTNTEVKFQGVS